MSTTLTERPQTASNQTLRSEYLPSLERSSEAIIANPVESEQPLNADILDLFPLLTPRFNSERGVLYTFSLENPSYLDFPSEGEEPQIDYQSLDVSINNTNTVIVSFIEKKTGLAKGSGKRWYNYKKVRSIIFSLKREREGVPYLTVYDYRTKTMANPSSFTNVTASVAARSHTAYRGQMLNMDSTFLPFELPAYSSKYETVTHQAYRKQRSTTISRLLELPIEDGEIGGVVGNIVNKALHHQYKKLVPGFSRQYDEPHWMVYAAYPTLNLLPLIPPTELVMMKAPGTTFNRGMELKPWIEKTYGKKAVRKDLIKAIAQCEDAQPLYLLHHLRGLVPVDWMFPLLKGETQMLAGSQYPKYTVLANTRNLSGATLRILFRHLSLAQRKRLLLHTSEQPMQQRSLFTDTLRMVDQLRERGHWGKMLNQDWEHRDATSWKALHDWMMTLERKYNQKSREIKQELVYQATDQTVFTVGDDKYLIHTPKETHELSAWGNELHNCIGSYANDAVKHRTHLFAITKEGTEGLYATAEYMNGSVCQFMENYNVPAAAEVRDSFQAAIQKQISKAKRDKKKAQTKLR